jgi:hypothetical protein
MKCQLLKRKLHFFKNCHFLILCTQEVLSWGAFFSLHVLVHTCTAGYVTLTGVTISICVFAYNMKGKRCISTHQILSIISLHEGQENKWRVLGNVHSYSVYIPSFLTVYLGIACFPRNSTSRASCGNSRRLVRAHARGRTISRAADEALPSISLWTWQAEGVFENCSDGSVFLWNRNVGAEVVIEPYITLHNTKRFTYKSIGQKALSLEYSNTKIQKMTLEDVLGTNMSR